MRHGEAVRGRNRLEYHRRHVTAAQRVFHGVEIVERDLDELADGVLGEKQLREAIVAGLECEPGMTVVGLDDRYDLSFLRGVACGLDGDVDRFAAAGAVSRVDHAGRRRAGGERLGQRGARECREVVVAHVEAGAAGLQRLDELGIAVAEIVRPAVEVQVDEPSAVHVVEVVTLAPVDHEIDPHVLPVLCLAGIPERPRTIQKIEFGLAHGLVSRSETEPRTRAASPA